MQTTDAAYEVLKKHGQAMDIHDLLDEALALLGLDREPRKAAKLYTDLNLDVRFQYRGNSQWSLKEWLPKTASRLSATTARERDDDEAEDLEEDEG
ncbi:MAG: DNA-directed RNA polymerase subunit delta [Sulfobacillus sp.]